MRVNCCFSPGGSLKNKIRSRKSPGKVQEFHHPKGVGTLHLASRDSTKTAARQYENPLSVGIWCVLY